MFNLGIGEILVIAIILIIVVGPDRLPELMRNLGKALHGIQKANRDLQASVGLDQLRRELLYPPLNTDELRRKRALVEAAAQVEPPVTPNPESGRDAAVLPAA